MHDKPDIPETQDLFGQRIAMVIAMFAVVLSIISSVGDNARTEAIIKANLATNKWGYFQSKSIKENIFEASLDVILAGGETASDTPRGRIIGGMQGDMKRYQKEKAEIKTEAELAEIASARSLLTNDRCDLAALFIQVGIVILSVSILAKWKPLCAAGIVLGLIGAGFGVWAIFLA